MSEAKEEHRTQAEALETGERAALLKDVMARQARLSIQVATVFILLLLGLPLLNKFAPAVARWNIGGFTLSWLVLGVLFYPLTWLLSHWFIQSSNAIEDSLAAQHRKRR